jgi:fructose-1,6-bisphosphatase-3
MSHVDAGQSSAISETDVNLLAGQYPSIESVINTIQELEEELNLPKGTEHFVSDLHGEYESFCHVVKNGSGSIQQAISKAFADQLNAMQQHQLTALVCYPTAVLSLKDGTVVQEEIRSTESLKRLVIVCRAFSCLYARSKIQQLLSPAFARPIETLLFEPQTNSDLSEHCQTILENIVASGSAEDFIITITELTQKLAISRMHVIGDIYDRGPGAHSIMDMLMAYHSVDIQWGNHDILWMGAAAGSEACIATAIRIALRYSDLETLQSGYGIDLLPLAALAVELYGDDPCERFQPKVSAEKRLAKHDIRLLAQMQKAIAVIQLKLEGQIVQRRPHYQMNDRLLLDKIDHATGMVSIDGSLYPLIDQHLPTISAEEPYTLTEAEQCVVDKLKQEFAASKSLQEHVRFLYSHGAMYHISNGHLLYHGCVAMNDDGSFKSFNVAGDSYAGKEFVDRVDILARQGYFSPPDSEEKIYGEDALWYLWCGEQSPLFGKQKMATFERYFVADKAVHAEGKNAYYDLRNDQQSAEKILIEFGIDPKNGRIVNGHVPVKVKKGESPIKANGKLLVIDGGFAQAYRGETGIAGYTLVSNSESLSLVAHKPFESIQTFIQRGPKIDTEVEIVETMSSALKVKDCDEGSQINKNIAALQTLLTAYQTGQIKQQYYWGQG